MFSQTLKTKGIILWHGKPAGCGKIQIQTQTRRAQGHKGTAYRTYNPLHPARQTDFRRCCVSEGRILAIIQHKIQTDEKKRPLGNRIHNVPAPVLQDAAAQRRGILCRLRGLGFGSLVVLERIARHSV